jgi:hypothetical protein
VGLDLCGAFRQVVPYSAEDLLNLLRTNFPIVAMAASAHGRTRQYPASDRRTIGREVWQHMRMSLQIAQKQ